MDRERRGDCLTITQGKLCSLGPDSANEVILLSLQLSDHCQFGQVD